eukprot:329846-Prymnesium_polylepis.1
MSTRPSNSLTRHSAPKISSTRLGGAILSPTEDIFPLQFMRSLKAWSFDPAFHCSPSKTPTRKFRGLPIGLRRSSCMSGIQSPLRPLHSTTHQRQILERKMSIEAVLPDSSIPAAAKLAFVDFGMRGMSSMACAARAGAAVLTSFTSSDNTLAAYELGKAYGEPDYSKIFGSIPAAEHMTITIHGQEGMTNLEKDKKAFLNMLSVYPTGPISV